MQPEFGTETRRLSQATVADLFNKTDNAEVFERVLERGGPAYLPELTAVYYARPSYSNGASPPETLSADHPLRQELEALDLNQVTDPIQYEVFAGLRASWADKAQGGEGQNENALTAQLLPGLIKENSAIVGEAIIDNAVPRLRLPTAEEYGGQVLRDVLNESYQKLAADDAFMESSADRLRLAFTAMSLAEAVSESDPIVADLPQAFENKACDSIDADIETTPHTMLRVRQLIASPDNSVRLKTQDLFLDDTVQAYTFFDAIASEPRLDKMLDKQGWVLAEFIGGVAESAKASPYLMAKLASNTISENFAQATTANSAHLIHYLARARDAVHAVSLIAVSPKVQAQADKFLEVHAPLSPKLEQRALRVFKTLARLGNEGLEDITDLDAVEQRLTDLLVAKLTDTEGELSDDERTRLLETFGVIEPLLLYSMQYVSQPEYKEQLAGMIKSIMAGEYDAWRRGDGTPEDLAKLKEAGYLPQNMTAEQYAEWCTDTSMSSTEQLMTSAADTAQAIRDSIARGSVDIELIAPGYSLDFAGLQMSIADRNLLGRLNGVINKVSGRGREGALGADEIASIAESMGELAETPGARHFLTRLSQGEDVDAIKKQIEGTRAELEQLRVLIRIANITPEEVLAGSLLAPAKDGGTPRPQQSLQAALNFLVSELPSELRFIPESAAQLLASSAEEQGGPMRMTSQETIDPKVTIEIGQTPQRTCQNYETGAFNGGLIGYFGPEVKLLVVRNDRGNIIARAVMRAMEGEDGGTVLFTEPVYQSIVSPQVKVLLSELAGKKAAKMGVELRGSLAEEQSIKPKELTVRKLKMPAVYSDQSGGQLISDTLTINT